MKTLVWDSSFKRAFRRVVRKNPQLEEKILEILEILSIDPFTPSLKTHKLSGQLEELWGCSVAYDFRIVFTFKIDKESKEDLIVLIDIGTHDEVY